MRDAIAELFLRMRKGAPSGIRRAYRLARHLTTPVRPSPPIPPELVRDCRVAASRMVPRRRSIGPLRPLHDRLL